MNGATSWMVSSTSCSGVLRCSSIQLTPSAAYSAFDNESRRRMERWLDVLAKEGALVTGDIEAHASFLNTVLNGLSLERAVPLDGPIVQRETTTLYAAVDAILHKPS